MSTWSNIPNAAVGVGGLPSATTVTALRDNPIAIANGASGAPRIQQPAIATGAVSFRTLGTLSAGNSVRARRDSVVENQAPAGQSSSYTQRFAVGFLQSGTVRITAEHRRTSGNGASEIRVRRLRADGASTMNSWTTTSGSFQLRSVDVSVRAGDVVLVEERVSAGAGLALTITETRNHRLSVATTNTYWPIGTENFPPIAEGNP
jgi:hypothetical protein